MKRLSIIIFVLLVCTASAVAGYKYYNDAQAVISNKQVKNTNEKIDTKKYHILVLGIDKRKNDIGRSNVTCVVTVDMKNKAVSMLWIPRDSRVHIPGHKWNKIGHAYAYGGPQLSEKTVSEFLGIPIDYYLAINMSGFKNVIDAIGGIDINVDKHLYYYDKYDAGEVDNDGLIDIKAGRQHMDGNIALEYVRFRHDPMGDIGRIGRQQKFANALLTAISTPGIIPQLPAIIRQIQNSFDTDIPITDMLEFSTLIPYIKSAGISTNMVDGTPVYINNISYWLPDIVKMRNQAAKLENIQVDQEYKEQSNILAQSYKKSLDDVKVTIAP